MRELLRGMARDLGVSLGDSPKPARDYSDAVPGSRAEGRGAGAKGWRQMWQAGIGSGVLRRRRRDAARFCRAGELPRLVWAVPGGSGTVLTVPVMKSEAVTQTVIVAPGDLPVPPRYLVRTRVS